MTDASPLPAGDEEMVIHEHFDASKEELWESIIDPDELSAWLGGECAIEATVGGEVRFELPEDGLVATGQVRAVSPPSPERSLASVSHTFVDAAHPEVTCVCSWTLIPTGDGCDLRFTLEGVDESGKDRLVSPWGRLRSVLAGGGPAPERRAITVEEATDLLRAARTVLLISWVAKEIPRTLVEAGFAVIAKNGPEPDNYGRAEIRDGDLEFVPVAPPGQADLLHLDWTIGFDEYLELARQIGVRTFWYHSAKTKHPEPADSRGSWVPPRKSARLRAAVEAAGMRYIDHHYIVDIARGLADRS